VQLLFVTVDPKRDTPELLASTCPRSTRHSSDFAGTSPVTEKVTKAFHVYVKPDAPKDAGAASNYTVSHSAQSFVSIEPGRSGWWSGTDCRRRKIAADLKVLVSS
jgi:protein SCO1/2